MKIAVEGCMHGELDKVYATLQHLEKVENTKIDLLLCCGDFQAARDYNDLKSMAAPPKYRVMNSFWKYFSGQAVAPYPTIFIGGNHEASNYLWELFYGGYAAPNIYFLGFAGVVKFGSLRIGGLSGTYYTQNDRLYRQGHFERPPYDDETIKSVNHVREYEVRKLMQVEEPLDVFLSHDWPRGITRCGDWKELTDRYKDRYKDRKEVTDRYKDRRRRRFVDEVKDGTLGSEAGARLLEELKPAYWFSAHMHCKFSAIVQHGEGGPCTKFLALDKCVAGREFLQVVEIESEPGPYEIRYDEEWLGITRRFNSVFPLTKRPADFGGVRLDKGECRQWVKSRLEERGSAKPYEFVRTVSNGSFSGHPRNPQTESLLQLLGLPYLLDNSPL